MRKPTCHCMRTIIFLLFLFTTSLICAAENTKNTRPNLIFLLADDQNTLSIGCYGNDEVQTPNMDQLGQDGIVFDKHYNTTAICMGSRANVFTGLYEYRHGCNFLHGDMKPQTWAQSYPILLRKNGYLTAFAGKFGLKIQGLGLPEKDFDTWGGGPGQTEYKTARNPSIAHYAKKYPHATLAYGAFGQDFIRTAAKSEKPFCLSISFKAPHRPTTPDPRFKDLYKDKTFQKPANYGRKLGEHLAPQSKAGRQYVRFHEWEYDDNYDEVMATYYRQVHGIDVALGMIRKELEKQGLQENTVIIYTSDNGFICGSHGYGSKVLPMEESSRVPLIIHDPRSKNKGKELRCNRLTGNIDFAPTLLELAGIPVPEDLDGISLVPLLENPSEGGHEQLAFMNVFGAMPTRSLSCLTQRYKYTYWWFGNEKMTPTEELFDLEKDPLELTNLAEQDGKEELLDKMRSRYAKELTNWKTKAVDYNDYTRFSTLFDSTIPMKDKQALLKRKK